MNQIANVKSSPGPRLMSFVKVVPFVVIARKDEEAVNKAFHDTLDGFVIRRIPIFDSGLESIDVEDPANAAEILEEMSDLSEED